jgi:hypothetical protein
MKDYADQDWLQGDRLDSGETLLESILTGIAAVAVVALSFLLLVMIGA